MRSMTEDSVFVYDRTWDGLLTAVFDAFYRHQFPVAIIGEKDTPPLFAVVHRVTTDEEKAGRVFWALQRKLSTSAVFSPNCRIWTCLCFGMYVKP